MDELTEEEVRRGLEVATALINRLADVEDEEGRQRIVRMLTSTDSGLLPDVVGMVDAVLDERDALRGRIEDAIARLERLSPQGSYTVAILKGLA